MGILNSILAIGGAGTRCRVALAVEAERHQVDTDSAKTPAYLFIAGVVGPNIGEVLTQRLPTTKVRLEDDKRAAARGALRDGDKALAHGFREEIA